ncbi:hypothetical protein TorRG33x02_174900 [Trema orientale]|uniref:Uncharacterized protein n=1 Tax=Trema orientale TaxID=63057 RepID=A0A2P5EM70_TREOI|nr:hypothetical protein TorRG33x02_174900 [Trema orientale]
MVDGGSTQQALNGDRSLDTLWAAQSALDRKVDILASDFHYFTVEIWREFQNLKNGGLQAPITTPATLAPTPVVRNTIVGTRVLRRPQLHDPLIQPEFSESDDDTPHQRFDFPHFGSDEEPTTDPYHRRRYRSCDNGFSDSKVKLDILFFDGYLHIEDYLD